MNKTACSGFCKINLLSGLRIRIAILKQDIFALGKWKMQNHHGNVRKTWWAKIKILHSWKISLSV